MIDAIAKILAASGIQVVLEQNTSPVTLRLPVESLVEVLQHIHVNENLFFDQLSCLTGIDNGPEANTLEVIYHLYSIPFNQSLAVKVVVPRENPVVPSVAHIWRTANWHEREAFDLLGIRFSNHPDLRRILMPADWEGHPLRKDYQEQTSYRGITVKYDREKLYE